MKQKDILLKSLAEFCRLLLGIVFIFSGFVKAVDPMGGAIKISEYLNAFGLQILQSVSVPLAFNLSAIEFVLGVCIFLGVYRRYTTFLIVVFMLIMTPLTFYLALFNPVSDCGCFGDALVISNWATFFKNIVLLLSSFIVLKYNQILCSCYSYRVYWFVALYAYVFGIGFAYYNYNHLPIIDFRPYKIGASIPGLMSIPPGAPQDEYNYLFVYEKNGVKQTFTLDNYPAEDSTWTFVESKTELTKKGYRPPVESFHLFNEAGSDISDVLLSDTGVVLLLISPKLESADDGEMDEINGLYDYSLMNQIPFYGVTGSTESGIEAWRDNTGAEYPFLQADEVLLKTMIRSNPGLIMLKNGIILGKWHYNDFPSEEQVKDVLDGCLVESWSKEKEEGRLITNLLTFTVPLLVVWGYDFIRFRRKKKIKTK